MNGMKNNKRNRKMLGYMSSPPQPQAKATKHMDTQIEDSSQAQLYKIQTPNQPSSSVGQAKLTRKELKARGACYYCKNEGHNIRECPKKRLDRLKKKAAKHDLNNNPEDQLFYKYDDEGRLISIHCGAKKISSLSLEEFNVN
jgi:YD repeat-containing protein